MLEGLLQGLALWLYGLLLEIVEFIADSLLEVFNKDMAYFEANVPVAREIVSIIIAAGWAILIGNLVFQAMKSMMSGIGFEGEDPKILFCRTFVFGFLLLASRQICEIGLDMTSQLNTLLQTPDAVRLELPPLDAFAIPGSWLLVMIMGIVLMFQIVKFFFEIAERYVVLVMLTLLAPLAFGVGGSKNTEDIFKGWARMFASACLMMVMNTVFLKLLLSAMSTIPSTMGMLPWMLLVVAIARVARKIDDIVARIGLNTARTGDPIGRGGIMYPIMVLRTLGQLVGKTTAASRTPPGSSETGRHSGSGSRAAPPPSSSGGSGGGAPRPNKNEAGGHSASSSAERPSPSHAGPQPTGTPQGAADTGDASPTRPPIAVGGRDRPISDGHNEDARKYGQSPPPDRPPLSVGSRRPDIPDTSGKKSPVQTVTQADRSNNSSHLNRPQNPVNIDIFHDDDLPGARDGTKPATAAGQAASPRRPTQAHTHVDSHSRRTTQESVKSKDEKTGISANGAATSPPAHASTPGAGRAARFDGKTHATNRNDGVTAPGASQRAPSSTVERPARDASPPVSSGDGAWSSAAPAADTAERPTRYRIASQSHRETPRHTRPARGQSVNPGASRKVGKDADNRIDPGTANPAPRLPMSGTNRPGTPPQGRGNRP